MNSNEALTYKEALSSYDRLDNFLQNKVKYLESRTELSENSKSVMWTKFRKDIHTFEYIWDKDLALFNEDDIKKVLGSIIGGTLSPAKTLLSIINRYEVWAMSVGLNTASNPCDTINLTSLVTVTKTIVDNTIISIDELFELWDYIQTYPNRFCDRVTYQNFAMILLMRIGLKGEKQWNEVMYLKEEDINFEDGIINVTNRDKDVVEGKKPLEVVKEISVEPRILKVIKRAIEEKEYEYNFNAGRGSQATIKKSNFYIDYGYIIKPEQDQGEIINSTVFRKRLSNFFDAAERKFISAKDIFRNAKLDMLLDLKESKGQLDIQDFKIVQDYFEPYLKSNTSYMSLKEFYVSYTQDDDILGTRDMTNSKSEEEKREERKQFFRDYYQNVLKERRRKQKQMQKEEE
ncbi:hypothetical protein [Clostridium sardiniense]|uniref:phage lytic cycle repressor MrpR family protein n=1 Tax=Clostridium sardiniense TaxID=29369 RepID=UPI00195C305C|nr:hypothetical protein [Clostridium sardiniense]MBM7836308.1 hypothetical protein [Clostridium sardiniense]